MGGLNSRANLWKGVWSGRRAKTPIVRGSGLLAVHDGGVVLMVSQRENRGPHQKLKLNCGVAEQDNGCTVGTEWSSRELWRVWICGQSVPQFEWPINTEDTAARL